MPAPPWMPRTLSAVALQLGWKTVLFKKAAGENTEKQDTGSDLRREELVLRMFKVDPRMTCLRESCLFSCRVKSSHQHA